MMYKELAKIPVPTAAEFVNTCRGQYTITPCFSAIMSWYPCLDRLSPITIQVFYSVTDFTKNVKRQMSKYLTVPLPSENSGMLRPSATNLEDTSGSVLQRNSPSRKKRAVLRKVSNSNGDSSITRIVEIWENGLLEASLNVTDLHGDFYADGNLSPLINKWSPFTFLRISWVTRIRSIWASFGLCRGTQSIRWRRQRLLSEVPFQSRFRGRSCRKMQSCHLPSPLVAI